MLIKHPYTSVKTNQLILIKEFCQLPYYCHCLTQYRCQCRTADTHIQTEDEDWIQNNINRHRHNSGYHRETRMTCRAKHTIQSEIDMR